MSVVGFHASGNLNSSLVATHERQKRVESVNSAANGATFDESIGE
jgi:hypothetical protein